MAAGRGETLLPSALPSAAEGTQISVADIFQGDQTFTEYTFQGFPGNEFAFQGLLVEGIYQAHKNAPVADGSFPLVIMVHGLGQFRSRLGQRGRISGGAGLRCGDGRHDIRQRGIAGVPRPGFALGRRQVLKRRFMRPTGCAPEIRTAPCSGTSSAFFISTTAPCRSKSLPDPSLLSPTPEGALRSGQLMADLFDQRVLRTLPA